MVFEEDKGEEKEKKKEGLGLGLKKKKKGKKERKERRKERRNGVFESGFGLENECGFGFNWGFLGFNCFW